MHTPYNAPNALADLAAIADDEANPSDLRLQAWSSIWRFVNPTSERPDDAAAHQLEALLFRLLRQIDAVTPRCAFGREKPSPARWLN